MLRNAAEAADSTPAMKSKKGLYHCSSTHQTHYTIALVDQIPIVYLFSSYWHIYSAYIYLDLTSRVLQV